MSFEKYEQINLEHCLDIILKEENWENIFLSYFHDKNALKRNLERILIVDQKLKKGTLSQDDIEAYLIHINAIRKLFSEKLNIFMSYSTKDSKHFKIAEIADKLEEYAKIANVFYWEEKSKEDIVEYMERILNISQVFILFCSKNASDSKAVNDEWRAAFQMSKKGLIKIIPIYEDEIYIPKLLMPLLNVKFSSINLEFFIENLYKEILR